MDTRRKVWIAVVILVLLGLVLLRVGLLPLRILAFMLMSLIVVFYILLAIGAIAFAIYLVRLVRAARTRTAEVAPAEALPEPASRDIASQQDSASPDWVVPPAYLEDSTIPGSEMEFLLTGGRSDIPGLRYPYENTVADFAYKGIRLRYIPVDMEELLETYLTADFIVPHGPGDAARFLRRDRAFAMMLGLEPRPDERLIDAWLRTMHRENGLPPWPPIHPAVNEALHAAPKALHDWLGVIRYGLSMGVETGSLVRATSPTRKSKARSKMRPKAGQTGRGSAGGGREP